MVGQMGLMAVLALGSSNAFACRCVQPVLAQIFENSTHVILGEVVRIDLASRNPVHGEKADYVAVLRAVETFKGHAGREVRVKFADHYANPQREGVQPEEIAVNSCDASIEVGERYLIFEKESEPLELGSWCSQRIQIADRIDLDYLRALVQPVGSPRRGHTRGR
jgi:hypothetical protein